MPQSDPLIGHILANYRIERLLGHGGMASVYFGIDLNLQRPAAIKVIDVHQNVDSTFADRFIREARTMASWRHPNIPHIYQAGQEAGFSFYAMEFIQGVDLDLILQQLDAKGELLPLADVILIGRSVAAALDYAHLHGAIHRDVKPSNVLISEDDRILLTDFGLVLNLDRGTHGEVFGSPHYIAPEQARSSSLAVPQSDLYALGVMLYEMLVGKLPFDDPAPISLAIKHMELEPPAPRDINPNLSPEIDAVLRKALRKQPQDRYQTGEVLMDALQDAAQLSATLKQLTYSWVLPATSFTGTPAEMEAQPISTLSELNAVDPEETHPFAIENSPSGMPDQDTPLQGRSSKNLLWIGLFLAACLISIFCLAYLAPRLLSGLRSTTLEPFNTPVSFSTPLLPTHTPTQLPPSQTLTQPATNTQIPQTPTSSITTEPTSSVTQSQTNTPTPIESVITSPEQFVEDYYSILSSGDYQLAWSMLSDNFKSTHNESGYQPYEDWWSQIKEIEVLSINIENRNTTSAKLSVELMYYYENGNIDTYDLMSFRLIFDSTTNSWLIDDATLVKGTR